MDAVMKSQAVPPDKLLVYRFRYWAHALTSASPRAKLHQYINELGDLWDTVPELSLLDESVEDYMRLLWQAVERVENEAQRICRNYLATQVLSEVEPIPERYQQAIFGVTQATGRNLDTQHVINPPMLAPTAQVSMPRLQTPAFPMSPLAAASTQSGLAFEDIPHFAQTVLSPVASQFEPAPLTEETFFVRLPVGVSRAIPIVKPSDTEAHIGKPSQIDGKKQFTARVSRAIPIVRPPDMNALVAKTPLAAGEDKRSTARASRAIPIREPPNAEHHVAWTQQDVQPENGATAEDEDLDGQGKEKDKENRIDASKTSIIAPRSVGVTAVAPRSTYDFIKSFSPYAQAAAPTTHHNARDSGSKPAGVLPKNINDTKMARLLERVCRADLEDGKQCSDEDCREEHVHSCRIYARHLIHSNRPPCLHGGDGVKHMDETGDDVGHFRRNCKKRFGYSNGAGEGVCNNRDCTYGHDHEAIRLPRHDTQSTPAAAQSAAATGDTEPVASPTNDTFAYSFSPKGKAQEISKDFWATVPKAPAAMLETSADTSPPAPKRSAHGRALDKGGETWDSTAGDAMGTLAKGALPEKKGTKGAKRVKMITAADDW